MKHVLKIALAAAAGVSLVACNPFLTGEGLTNDPNNPTTATREALFMGVQATTWGQQESSPALTVCMWMQQCTGGGGRFVEQFGHYLIDEGSFSFDFNSVYTGGGLTDIRKVEASARDAGDLQFLGIAQIYEALVVGTAADIWGDIPYTQALTTAAPALDNQFAVYDSVQALLSRAIANLGGAGPGPGDRDLVFGGVAASWIKVAHTMKARYFLHTVEAAGAGLLGTRTAAQVYADVIAQATLGIADASGAGDFRAFHGQNTSERNVWYQFSQTTFGTDLVAGKRLVDFMKARNDPRLPQYFGRNAGNGFGGDDVNASQPADSVSAVDGTRNSPTFRQPFVSYAENELILAEANNRGTPANYVVALQHLNNERAAAGLAATAGAGAALLDSIMTEKYVAMFQNIEVWSDYKRTCRPALVPYTGPGSGAIAGKIPGRFFYGSNERNTNQNIPDPSAQVANNGFRNRNDPTACP
jgi:starch-binding outer membrane protein, SusD/RagB family